MELENKEIDPLEVAGNFRLEGRAKSVLPFGSGHINDTFKVITGNKNYLLQRVNQQVFMDVRGLTSNMVRVLNFLRDQVDTQPSGMVVLNTVVTLNGTYFYIDSEAGFWRMFEFVEGSKSYNRANHADLAREGGRAFGWFIRRLDKFPIQTLVEIIPAFHLVESRLANFRKAVERNRVGRVAGLQEDIQFLEQRADSIGMIHRAGLSGEIPVRVTHNDTKINNVLFDEHDKALCVIDLDTVMPGYVHFDFGDAIRTFANTADEDESDRNKIKMDIDLFKAFAEGYLSETRSVLSNREIELLAFSPLYITWEQATRFLTDHLNGDLYYKINFPGHNLVRARAQMKLLQSMEDQAAAMEAEINQLR